MPILILTAILAATFSIIGGMFADTMTHPISLLGSFAALRLSHNSGIAFSIALPPALQSILISVALIFVCVLATKSRKNRLATVAFGLIIGGAIANLFDRIPDGLVTDFISVGTFPIFNLADSCITVGAAILLIEELLRKNPSIRDKVT